MRTPLSIKGLSAPRYTSYPAHPHWKNPPTAQKWAEHVAQEAQTQAIDLYCHIPFCQSLCHYCGCNRIITSSQERSQRYLDALLREVSLYRQIVPNAMIRHVHLGGGTPTFLTAEQLRQLCSQLQGWNCERQFSGSVEVDPRVTNIEQLEVLWAAGFRKLSLGIQDFDEKVQHAIHRLQPFELVRDFVTQAMSVGPWELNFDLIYGLPGQGLDSIARTIEQTLELAPHNIAFFSYAHVPWKMPHQKSLERFGIPDDELRQDIFESGKRLLMQGNYHHIGLDHFSREGSSLLEAYYQKRMARNFMGHVIAPSPILLGLGASSISSTPLYYMQNEKEVARYQTMVNSGQLPCDYGHTLSSDDRILGQVIHDLMCYQDADISKLSMLEQSHSLMQLDALVAQGLVVRSGSRATVVPDARALTRWICSQLDWRIKPESASMSRL